MPKVTEPNQKLFKLLVRSHKTCKKIHEGVRLVGKCMNVCVGVFRGLSHFPPKIILGLYTMWQEFEDLFFSPL